ncbi:hypothetical protein EDC04DRAFT_2910147 [Pisolithus marmoratus]|nr:hypothetical protein EDC04DRAFT_2910147 [Pisolithus marmoratus]
MDPTDDVSRKRAKLERYPPGHTDRGVALTILARALNDRLQKEWDIVDMEEAITLRRAALELPLSAGSKSKPAMGDLEEAIELFRAALILRPPGHPDRCSSLHNLASCLSNRYDNQGLVADLEEVVTLARAALDLCPARGSQSWCIC